MNMRKLIEGIEEVLKENNYPSGIKEEVKKYLEENGFLTGRLKNIASAIASDLLYGPFYVDAPKDGNWENWDEDYRDYTSLDDYENPIELYTSPLADELRNAINDFPTLWYDRESGSVQDTEPKGWYDEDDLDDEGEPTYYEPNWEDYWELETNQVVELVFGSTIAKEFH